MNVIAATLATDWMNDDHSEVIRTLSQCSPYEAALVAVLAYKELQNASESVSVDPEAFLNFLRDL